MEDIADRLARWAPFMTHCPPVSELKTSTFIGIPLGDMTTDQLMQVIWALGRSSAPPVKP